MRFGQLCVLALVPSVLVSCVTFCALTLPSDFAHSVFCGNRWRFVSRSQLMPRGFVIFGLGIYLRLVLDRWCVAWRFVGSLSRCSIDAELVGIDG